VALGLLFGAVNLVLLEIGLGGDQPASCHQLEPVVSRLLGFVVYYNVINLSAAGCRAQVGGSAPRWPPRTAALSCWRSR